MSSSTPEKGASPEHFDFLAECIDTYMAAKHDGDTDARIKALALFQKVQLPKAPVKVDEPSDINRSAVQAAQDKLRKQ